MFGDECNQDSTTEARQHGVTRLFQNSTKAEIQQTAVKTIAVILIMRVGFIAFPLSDGPLIFL